MHECDNEELPDIALLVLCGFLDSGELDANNTTQRQQRSLEIMQLCPTCVEATCDISDTTRRQCYLASDSGSAIGQRPHKGVDRSTSSLHRVGVVLARRPEQESGGPIALLDASLLQNDICLRGCYTPMASVKWIKSRGLAVRSRTFCESSKQRFPSSEPYAELTDDREVCIVRRGRVRFGLSWDKSNLFPG